MKPNLSTTTLICVDCLIVSRAIKAMERCKALCDFADVKLLTSLPTDYAHKVEIAPINNLVHYSVFMLKRIHEFVDTKHMLIVQHDGWILNPQKWEAAWENLDFISALFNQFNKMGGGGFSFRSKALMESVSKKYPLWAETPESTAFIQRHAGMYEDGAIAIIQRRNLEAEGFKFATLEQGARFAQGGNPDSKYYVQQPFGFHGGYRAIDQVTGTVSPHCIAVDLPEPL